MSNISLTQLSVKLDKSLPPYKGKPRVLVERVHQDHLGVEVTATIDVATRKVSGWSVKAKDAA